MSEDDFGSRSRGVHETRKTGARNACEISLLGSGGPESRLLVMTLRRGTRDELLSGM